MCLKFFVLKIWTKKGKEGGKESEKEERKEGRKEGRAEGLVNGLGIWRFWFSDWTMTLDKYFSILDL